MKTIKKWIEKVKKAYGKLFKKALKKLLKEKNEKMMVLGRFYKKTLSLG
jgi:hypothetical protein